MLRPFSFPPSAGETAANNTASPHEVLKNTDIKRTSSAWLGLAAGLSLSIVSLGQAQQTLVEQDFENIPEGFVGRFGTVSPGPQPYGIEGRWSEFGTETATPRVQVRPDGEGQAVFLRRENDSRPLIGVFNPIHGATRFVLECDLWLSREGNMVVSINSQNTQLASVLLRTQAPGIAVWNPRDSAWEPISDQAPSEQWIRLTIDCDYKSDSYTVTLAYKNGAELLSAQGLLDPKAITEGGLNNILFNPQPGSSEDCMVDQVLVNAWF